MCYTVLSTVVDMVKYLTATLFRWKWTPKGAEETKKVVKTTNCVSMVNNSTLHSHRRIPHLNCTTPVSLIDRTITSGLRQSTSLSHPRVIVVVWPKCISTPSRTLNNLLLLIYGSVPCNSRAGQPSSNSWFYCMALPAENRPQALILQSWWVGKTGRYICKNKLMRQYHRFPYIVLW